MKISIEHEDQEILTGILRAVVEELTYGAERKGSPEGQAPGFTYRPENGYPVATIGQLQQANQPTQGAEVKKTKVRRTKEQIAADEAAEAAAKAAGVPALQPVPDIAPPVQTAPNFGQQPPVAQFDPAQAAIYGQQAPPAFGAPAQLPPPVNAAPVGETLYQQLERKVTELAQNPANFPKLNQVFGQFQQVNGQPLDRVSNARPEDYSALLYNLSN